MESWDFNFIYYFYINIFFKIFSFPTIVSGSIFCNIGFVILSIMVLEFLTGVLISFGVFGGNLGVSAKLRYLNNYNLGYFVFKVHSLLPNFISMFIILHIFRSFINFSNSSKEVIISGFLLLVFFISSSYTGYSLSKGSMAYWAVVVVNGLIREGLGSRLSSSLFFQSSIGLGDDTFSKIFTYHFLISSFIILLQFVHIFLLHISGSSNYISSLYLDYFKFNVSMFVKDIFLFIILLLNSLFFIFYSFLEIFGENFLEINEFKSLDLSVEWYVRMFFIILRGVCFKVLGILFTIVFLIIIVLNFFIKDIFRFDNFTPISFYTSLFVFNIFFINLSYFGFSSCISLISITLLIYLVFVLDGFIIKFFPYVIKF